MHTTINILKNDEQFHYIVKYKQLTTGSIAGMKYVIPNIDSNAVFFGMDNSSMNYLQHNNIWVKLNDSIQNTEYLPDIYNIANISLCFPNHSIESYVTNYSYAITISIHIGDKNVILGSKIIDRIDSIAMDQVEKYMDQEYCECIEFNIIDPYFLIYSDEWEDFRIKICNESTKNHKTLNSTGSQLYISLHPVEFGENDTYIKTIDYTGGQNLINIAKEQNDFLNLRLTTNTDTSLIDNQEPSFDLKLQFNQIYENDIYNYIKDTYNLSNFHIKYGLVIGNKNDIYVSLNSPEVTSSNYSFLKSQISSENFYNWNGWSEGIFILGSVDIINEYGESILYLLSNKLNLTQEIFKYFINSDLENINKIPIYHIELNDIDMQNITINAVNKIENTIVQLSDNHIKNNSKNLTTPVFYRVADLSQIIIHPEVTENICINLDAYKSYVDNFILQIEGVKIIEIGRTSYGVLFKVIGKTLPKKSNSGNYYIMNQDYEMITTGQYKYV